MPKGVTAPTKRAECKYLNSWEIFNEMEIDACLDEDNGPRFPPRIDVRKHIADCSDCSAKLGRWLAQTLIAHHAWGVWPVSSDIHHLDVVTAESVGET